MNDKNKNFAYIKNISDNIINNFSISSIIKNYINITKKGKDYKALCPFHGDSDPSFSISDDRKCFNCFACNQKGNAITFVMKFKNISFVEAVKEISKLLNISDVNLDILDKVSTFNKEDEDMFMLNEKVAFIYNRMLYSKDDSRCINYLKNERQLSDEIINFYKIGFAPKNESRNYLYNLLLNINDERINRPPLMLKSGIVYLNDNDEYLDFFENRLIIPIHNEQGKIVGFSGRTLDKNLKIKYLNTKTTDLFKKEEILFNFFSFDKKAFTDIYIVEGYMDVFAYKKLGIDNVVATMGTAFTESYMNLIKKYKNIKNIIISLDNDNAGREATKKMVKLLAPNNFSIFIISPFDNKWKDIDELVKNNTKEKCLEIINKQISFIQYEIQCFLKQNLSYKDKKTKTKILIEFINDFAYDPMFINDDLKELSNFSGVSEDDLSRLINKKSKKLGTYSQNTYNNKFPKNNESYSERIFSNYKNNNFHLASKKTYVTNEEKENEKIKNVEKNLIALLLFNNELTNYYNKYIGFIAYNNEGYLNKILRTILEHSKENLLNNNEDLSETFKAILSDKDLTQNEKRYFINFVQTFSNENKFILENKNEILKKGLSLIKCLIIEIYRDRIIKEKDIKEIKQREILKHQRDIKIKEIDNLIDNFDKSFKNS